MAAISAPLALWLVQGIPVPGRLPEERFAHARPALPRDLAELTAFPRSFENWFGDALGGRGALLAWRSREFVGLLGVSPTPVAYIGEDGWLFLSGGRELDTQRGAVPLGRFELDVWVQAIRARQAFCREHGAEYVFAIAPDKTYVYPERHALAWKAVGPTRTDQLKACFDGDPVFLDLRPSLLAAKGQDRADDHAYFPYGSHWTDRGAAAAMRALGEHVRKWPKFERWPSIEAADIEFGPPGEAGDNWEHRLYLPGRLPQYERAVTFLSGAPHQIEFPPRGGGVYVGRSTSTDASLPSIVMFHDSFGQAAYKFVARAASRSLALWDFFQPNVVIEEKPDLVIDLFVERVLGRPPIENLAGQVAIGRSLFEAARPLFVMDLARDFDAIAARAGIEAHLVDGAIHVRWTEPAAIALLPARLLPDSAHAIVRLEVEVDEPTDANFHFKTAEKPQYDRANAITKVLPTGRSEVFLHFAVPDVRGPIAFRTNRAGVLKIISCESRLLD